MSHPNSLRKFGVFLLVGLIFGMLTLKTQPAAQANSGDPSLPSGKIDPLVLQQVSAGGETDFFLRLTEQADLSEARQLASKADKGRLVLERLTSNAQSTQSGLIRLLENRGATYRSFYITNLILVKQGDPALLQELAARPEVARISPNRSVQLLDVDLESLQLALPPKTTVLSQPASINENLIFINADDVWAMGYTGQGVVLAGMDTGLDAAHPAIAPHYRGCLNPPECTEWDHNYSWWDATGMYPDEPHDGNGHGTMTTGVMVGDDGGENQIGVAPGAKTIHCKALTDGGGTDDAKILECLEWFLAPWDLSGANPDPAMAPDALAVTWGYPGGYDYFQTAFDALQNAGILVAPAAGGEGPGCSTVGSPGDYPELLTIGSADGTGGIPLPGELSPFSAKGPAQGQESPPYFPDVIAPGIDIKSSFPGGDYQVWSGTSLATPHAPGLAALCWAANPDLRGDPWTTMDIIKEAAVPLTGELYSDCGGDYINGPNNDWGYGTIDALATVNACLAAGGIGTLAGQVTEAVTAEPLAGATVSALSEGGSDWEALSDETGIYTLTLPSGVYTVTALHPGYLPATETGVEVLTGTVTTRDFALQPGVSFAPAPVEMTLEWLTSGQLPVTLTNLLGEPFDFTFAEIPEDAPWLGQSPASGSIPPESSLPASLYFTATIEAGIDLPGDYTATLLMEGDIDLEIPVSLHVTGEALAPTASFTITQPACQANALLFTNTTTPGNPPETDYLWDFGDGATSTDENPAHIYTAAGEYTALLSACNAVGCTTSSLLVEVLPLPAAGFEFAADHLTVAFTNTSANGETYLWDFGDSFFSTELNPLHVYNFDEYVHRLPMEMPVSLSASNACGVSQLTQNVTVEAYQLLLPIVATGP